MAKKAPEAPKSLTAPKRENTTKFSTTWTKPGSGSSDDRKWDYTIVNWAQVVRVRQIVNGKTKYVNPYGRNPRSVFKSNKRGRDTTNDSVNINRKSYYPLNKNRFLNAIQVQVISGNNKGKAQTDYVSINFEKPPKPSVTFDYDDATGLLTMEVTSPTKDRQDRYDCAYKVYRTDVKTGSSYYKDKKKTLALNPSGKPLSGSSTKETFKLYTNIQNVFLEEGSSIKITVELTSRGFAGDTINTQTYTISNPTRALITEITTTTSNFMNQFISSKSAKYNAGVVRVRYKADARSVDASYNQKDPTMFSLERLVTPYDVNSPAKAGVQSGWKEVDTNMGSTSENKSSKIVKKLKLYSGFTLSGSKGFTYYKAYDNKAKKWVYNIRPWKVADYKKATYTVGKKKKARYSKIAADSARKNKKLAVYKSKNKKTKKWKTNIPEYSKDAYVKNSKTWSAPVKTGTRYAKYWDATNQQTGKKVKNIPEWSLNAKKKQTYQVTQNRNDADGVMGELITDVLNDMSFTSSGSVYDKRVWYRIKSARFGRPAYSAPKQATQFAIPTPSASKDYSGFMRLDQSTKEPGTAIVGTVGWDNKAKKDEGVDNKAWADADWTTLVEWSEHASAIKSNASLNNLEIDWKNSSDTHKTRQKDYNKNVKSGKFGKKGTTPVTWNKSADFTIYGLTPGVPIYLWTRRHMVLDSYDDYGPRSAAPYGFQPFTPIDNPSSVMVFTPEYYVLGTALTVSWAHDATCDQKQWNVYLVPGEPSTIAKWVTGTTNAKAIMQKAKLIACGTGKTDTTTISASTIMKSIPLCRYAKDKAFTVKTQMAIVVGVSTGGAEIYSCQDVKKKYTEVNTLKIAMPPSLEMYMPKTIQDGAERKVFLFTNSTDMYVSLGCYADMDTRLYLPDGTHIQALDECVWDTRVPVTAFRSIDRGLTKLQKKDANIARYARRYTRVAVVQLPVDSKVFYDGTGYRMEARGISSIDRSLVSQTQTRHFINRYSHQAAQPGKLSRVQGRLNEAYVLIAESAAYSGIGIRDLAGFISPPMAYIYVSCPEEGYSPTDRANVYRITPDGGVLIAENIPFERIVVDRFAPFSKTALTRYAVMTVTKEGDMSWRELGYSLRREGMRFDWGTLDRERAVELPYDIELDESYAKDSRIDSYIDGTVTAKYNKGVVKTEKVKTKLVRLSNPMQFELVKELAQYPGTAYFRAHNGDAFECDVVVDGLENSYEEQVSPVSFELTRVTLSDRYKPLDSEIVSVMDE